MEELVRAARLAPSVGPFTLRRLLLRARVFSSGPYSADEIRVALPGIQAELREILPADEFVQAQRAIDAILTREASGSGPAIRTS